MIEKLTQAQEKRMIEFRQTWLEIGLNTQPADRPRAEQAISEMYKLIGKKPPTFVWCQSILEVQLYINTKANLWDNLWANLRANLRDNLRANLGANLRDNLRDNLGANLRANLRDNLRDHNLQFINTFFWGQQDSYWIAYYLFAGEIGVSYSVKDSNLINLWSELAQSCLWWWPFERECIILERMNFIGKDENGRLHNLSGPAYSFRDGYGAYYVHGVHVPEYVIERPQEISVKKIDEEPNAEVGRVMIDQYGPSRFLIDAKAKVIHQDEFGILYRRDIRDDEPIVMVKVVNSTPALDGTRKEYYIRVDPQLRPLLKDNKFGEPQQMTAHNAIASTFGLRGKDYQPLFEA